MHRQYQLVTGCLHQMSSLFVCWIKNRNNQSAERWWLLLQEFEFTNTQTQVEADSRSTCKVDGVRWFSHISVHHLHSLFLYNVLLVSSDRLHVTSSKPRMCQKLKYSCGGLHQNNSWFSYKIMSLILFIKVYRYYIGFKFPPFLGHWRTFKEWSWFSPFLCPYCHCPVGRWTFAPVGGPDCSGAGY